jgi:hypothetical protein
LDTRAQVRYVLPASDRPSCLKRTRRLTRNDSGRWARVGHV